MFGFVFVTFNTFSSICEYNIALFVLVNFCFLVATVELVAVGGKYIACTSESVTLQCTVMGDFLTWNTPEGALNLVRGRQDNTIGGSFQAMLINLNDTHLRSTLTFNITSQTTINCSDINDRTESTITFFIEGIIMQDVATLHFSGNCHLCRSTKCPRSPTDSPGQDQETEQDILLSDCGVEHS